MKLTLNITASAAALSAILANLPNDGSTTVLVNNVAAQDEDDASGDVAPVAGQLDADGLPHDARIHSDVPTLTSKGVWRKRRGVDKDVIAEVEAELRTQPAQPSPMPVVQQPVQPVVQQPVQPSPMPMPMPGVEQQPAQPVAQQPVQPVAQQPVQPVAQQPVQPVAQQPVQPQTYDFGSFMSHLTTQMGAQKITADYLAAICSEISTAFGVTINAITDVATDPNKINYAVQLFQRDQRW